MAPLVPKRIYSWSPGTSASGAKFRYPRGVKTDGALRVISIQALLKKNTIEVWEYPTIRWNKNPKKNFTILQKSKTYRYVAISHVWDPADGVQDDLDQAKAIPGRTIDIALKDNKVQTIGLDGLEDVARAIRQSKNLGKANYFWLDFLCLDQTSDSDKTGQICLMSDIYKYSSRVIVMIGGVSSVHAATEISGWMDRAWTLQETVLNRNYTYVYIKWDSSSPTSIRKKPKSSNFWRLEKIRNAGPQFDLCLIHIRDLLDLADASPRGIPKILALDGKSDRAGDVPRRALRAAISKNPQIRAVGIWRSMFLRTSSLAVDVIYSTMGCFQYSIKPNTVQLLNLPLDPYRKNRSPAEVFNDFCRKMATQKSFGPAFLTIGGIEGSDLPYQMSSLLPVFPHMEAANQISSNDPPVLTFGNKSEWVGHHVADSPYYVKQFDMAFHTHSYPHVVNAILLRVQSVEKRVSIKNRALSTLTLRKRANVTIGGMSGSLSYWGNNYLSPSQVKKRQILALYVGIIGDMQKQDKGINFPSGGTNFNNQRYLLFLEYDRSISAWRIRGNGTFSPAGGKWKPPTQRWVFTLGPDSQTRLQRWPTARRDWVDTRITRFNVNSYGILPVPDFNSQSPMISWFGKRGQAASNKIGFRTFKVTVDLEDLTDEGFNREFQQKRYLRVVACKTSNPPTTAKPDFKAKEIRELGVYHMPFSYDGWTKSMCLRYSQSGLSGILVPKLPSGSSRTTQTVSYWGQLWFGKSVIYLLITNNTKKPREYWDMTVVPYGPADGRTLNRPYSSFKGITSDM